MSSTKLPMYTVLVHYQTRHVSPHALLDDTIGRYTEIVEVLSLIDLNDQFKNITKVDVLERPQPIQ